ncbi:uncharacterized protein FSUBG_12353 [Fusarium subglutinans]|uniref:Uncharacterized protein n=1 Tax=Gibberella subglutinans TaxID=42677 RepID=A0A8H5L3P0_GIBSU|nr:uncharacterized protein FSUBG_12353 [Fusarium subglutinans]KAF5585764.1 hypothetical protein FSUBG_12353 [Fusarium subglutinans]
MSFSTPPTFDHSKIGVCDVAARRAHMKAFFLHLGLWDEEKVKTYRQFSEEQACNLVHVAGHIQMGNALGQGHDWPWRNDGLPDKMDVTTAGASQFYREWLHRNFGVCAEVQQIIATGQILNLNGLHSYRDYIPADIHVECLFSGVSARFPHHRIHTLDIPEVQRYVVATLEGAFPSRTKFYTNDEILLRTKYKIVR